MQKGFRVLLLCVGFLFLSCAKGGPFVTLHVLDLPIGTNALSLKVTANGTSKEQRFSGSDPLTLFTVELPAGTRGETRFDLEALTTDCVLGNGSAVLQIEEDTAYELEATMAIKADLSCGFSLKLVKAGTGIGEVKSKPGGLKCGVSCNEQVFSFPKGTQISLTAIPSKTGMSDDIFVKWDGDCKGTQTDCTFTITQNSTVTATFDKCQGFCPMPTTGTTKDLYAVWGGDQKTVYAVGADGTMLKWDGAAWSSVTSGVTSHLRAVSAARDKPSLVFVGGDNKVFRSFDGTNWKAIANKELDSQVNGIAANTSNSIYIVGTGGMYLKWDGDKGWSRPQALLISSSQILTGISLVSSSEEHFFTGMGGYCRRYDTFAYWQQKTNTSNDLLAVWAGPSATYVVGKGGTIARRPAGGGQDFTLMTSGTTADLRSVSGANDSMIFAVGDAGVALKGDGTSWTALRTGTTQPLYGVYAVNSSTIIAVGGSGTALIYNP